MATDDVKRYKNTKFNKNFTENKPFVSKNCQLTTRLKRSILNELRSNISITDIAKKYLVSPKTVSILIDLIEIKRLQLAKILHIDELK